MAGLGKLQLRYQYLVVIGLGLVFFVASALLARSGQMQAWETRLFRAIFGWPDSLRWPFLVITQCGSALAVLATSLISYLSGYRRLAWRMLLSGYTAYLIVVLAKDIVNRPRPYELLSGIHERELVVSGNGFPSGHTAVATALALTVAPHLPKHWRWLPLAWIVSVALSRIYLGVHAPLDIVGGFGVGLAVAGGLHFLINTDRKLRRTQLR